MPNHWHFVVRPFFKEELSEFFQYLTSTHAKRFRVFSDTRGEGHVYQDRFKSFPVEDDDHFLCACRYVERNALSANLVTRAQDWQWSGLWRRLQHADNHLTSGWPVDRPRDWTERVNTPLSERELAALQNCMRRGAPFGSRAWVRETATELGLERSLRPLGRPRISAR